MHKPLISVVMSVYNNRDFVGAAIQSIVSQSFSDFEFLITDDGSTDGSSAIIDEFAAGDDRIRVFHQANKGLTLSLNEMIARSCGAYLARMDADDISHPQRFERQVNYLNTHVKCAAVGAGYVIIDAQDSPIGGVQAYDKSESLRNRILGACGNPLCHGSVMMRRDALIALEPIYRWQYSQDFDLWVRLLMSWDVGVVDAVLYKFRRHDNGLQARKNLVPLRLAQRRVIVDLVKQGLIFDNEACGHAIAEIYRKPMPDTVSAPKYREMYEQQIRALFFRGDFKSLREKIRSLRITGCAPRWRCILWLISWLPRQWGHAGYDFIVRLSWLIPQVQRRLLMREMRSPGGPE